jgi:hypothetical protein
MSAAKRSGANLRKEPGPLPGHRVGALVVHPRRGHPHRARAGPHLPALVIAIADHLPAALALAFVRDYGEHRIVTFPTSVPAPILPETSTRSPGRYNPFLSPFPADPQVSSIARAGNWLWPRQQFWQQSRTGAHTGGMMIAVLSS